MLQGKSILIFLASAIGSFIVGNLLFFSGSELMLLVVPFFTTQGFEGWMIAKDVVFVLAAFYVWWKKWKTGKSVILGILLGIVLVNLEIWELGRIGAYLN